MELIIAVNDGPRYWTAIMYEHIPIGPPRNDPNHMYLDFAFLISLITGLTFPVTTIEVLIKKALTVSWIQVINKGTNKEIIKYMV